MELKVIENLLEKYLNAETSIKEEERLRSYFASGDVAPHLQEYAPMFTYFNLAKQESYSREIKYTSGRKTVFSLVAVAASVVIVLGVIFQENTRMNEFGTYEDPEIALQKTKEALEMVSMYMNTGAEDLGYLHEFNSTKNKIVKNP